MRFADMLREEGKWTLTENGAAALRTTSDALLDMFSSLAAMRNQSAGALEKKFELAFIEDPLGALRCLFYVRDVRGGQGEREIFRTLIRYIAGRHMDELRVNLPCIPFYGRWDDLYALVGTQAEADAFALMKAQLEQDMADMKAGKPVSLLAKWLKKANSTNEKTKKLGIRTAQKLGMSVYDYKRVCSKLRRYLEITEVKMSERKWKAIDYAAVPSRAMMIYRKAFREHDASRFDKYINAVSKGEAKISAATLYPYDIVEKILYQGDRSAVLEAQWENLPNYVTDDANFLVMADVSGSMCGRPMASSIALAMYFAERNRGAYHNLFMTFSARPQIVTLQGSNLFDRVRFMEKADWGCSTNFEAAMKLVLDVAVRNRCKQKDLPKAIICVTDMEFDAASQSADRKTFTEHVRKMFAAHGYTAPVLVFWNVNSRKDTFHAGSTDTGVVLVGGQSASTFENLIRSLSGMKPLTPVDFMYDVLDSERYGMIQLTD